MLWNVNPPKGPSLNYAWYGEPYMLQHASSWEIPGKTRSRALRSWLQEPQKLNIPEFHSWFTAGSWSSLVLKKHLDSQFVWIAVFKSAWSAEEKKSIAWSPHQFRNWINHIHINAQSSALHCSCDMASSSCRPVAERRTIVHSNALSAEVPLRVIWYDYMGKNQWILMEEILHRLVGSLSHYLQGFLHPKWLFGISSITNNYRILVGWSWSSSQNSAQRKKFPFKDLAAR